MSESPAVVRRVSERFARLVEEEQGVREAFHEAADRIVFDKREESAEERGGERKEVEPTEAPPT